MFICTSEDNSSEKSYVWFLWFTALFLLTLLCFFSVFASSKWQIMNSIPLIYIRRWAAAQVKSQISHPYQNKAVKHLNWIYSPPVSRTRLPEWSKETSTRPGSKVWSITQAKFLKFASTSSSIRGSPHYETKDPSNWTRKITVRARRLLNVKGFAVWYTPASFGNGPKRFDDFQTPAWAYIWI